MAKNYSGRDYKLWVASSAPGSGALESNYTQVGKLISVSVETSRNAIETSSKDDGDDSAFIGGRRNTVINGSAIYDHTDDAGQAIIAGARDSASGSIWFLVTPSNASDNEFYGAAVVTSVNYGFDDEAASTIDFSFQVTGALTEGSDSGT